MAQVATLEQCDLRRTVLIRGLAIAIIGTIVGLGNAVLANRLLEALLYDVTPADLMTLSLVGLVLVSVATFASLISAAAIARIDPVLALRSET